MEATETFEDEAAIQVLIDEIENAASVRAWTPEQKAACGVVVSLYDGELCVQRGVQKKIQTAASDGGEHGGEQASVHVVTRSMPDAAEGISVPLLKKCLQKGHWRFRPNWLSSHRKPWP
jgi:ParB family chromosome partitioning protein